MDNLSEFITLGLRAVAFAAAVAVLLTMTDKINNGYDKVYINIVNDHAVKGTDNYE